MGPVHLSLMLAIAMSGADLPAAGQAERGGAADQEQNVIVVTGRLEDVKIDYRLSGGQLRFCGPRDRDQDLDDARAVCRMVQDCIAGGNRSRNAVAACVDLKIVQQRSRSRD